MVKTEYLTIKQVIQELGIGPATFYRWQGNGDIKTKKFYGSTIISRAEVERVRRERGK